jgi:hypothetical protein
MSDQLIYTKSGGFQVESEISRNSQIANTKIKPIVSQVSVFSLSLTYSYLAPDLLISIISVIG